MSSTINAVTTSGGGVAITPDSSGILQLQSAGSTIASVSSTGVAVTGALSATTMTIPSGTSLATPTLTSPTISGAVVSSMASSVLTSSTAVASTSGTSIDFTGIPAWAKRITIMFNGVSTNGTSIIQMQIGSGSVDTTSTYLGSVLSGASGTLWTTGMLTAFANVAANISNGNATLTLQNASTNTWCISGLFYLSNGAGGSQFAGAKSLSGTLDRIRITTVNGTDTFDAGSINIMFE